MADDLTTATLPIPPTVRVRARPSVVHLALGLYAVAIVVALFVLGVPTGRQMVFAWVFVGLLAASAASPKQGVKDVIRDWLPLFVVLATYDELRGVAAHTGIQPHVFAMLDFDHFIAFGHTPTVWLQQHFFDAQHLRWWDYVLCTVYISHFIAPIAIAGVLWVRNRVQYRRYAVRIVALSYAAFLTYVVFPAVPPWMASQQGHIAATVRTQKFVWSELGVKSATVVVNGGSNLVNDVAAVPSLHAAFPALICLFFWPMVGRRTRVFLVAYVLAMGLALVYGAEHWVFDILLGWIYAAAVMAVAAWVAKRRARKLSTVIDLTVDTGPDEPDGATTVAFETAGSHPAGLSSD
ncbi:MAG: phosphatase PAP2 family protein [Acidimicrobiia bacterium]